jgi:hypothetical protein
MTIMALSFLLVQYAVGEILVLAFFIPYGVGLEPNSGPIIRRYQRLRASRKRSDQASEFSMILLTNFHPFRSSEPLTASSMARSGLESVKYARSWLL